MFSLFKKWSCLFFILIMLMVVVSCSPTKSLREVTESKTASSDSFKETKSEELDSSALESIAAFQGLNIIPLEVTETFEFYFFDFFSAKETGLKPSTPVVEPGWKFVNIRLAFENPSDSLVTVNPLNKLPDISLKTEQGWLYELDTSYRGQNAFLPFWQSDKNLNSSGQFKIPAGLRISGDTLFFARAPFNIWSERGYYYLVFKAAEKSSGYTLLISGYPDINLNSNLNELVFPTILPNSSFRSIGDTINISDKGSFRVSGFTRTNDLDTVYTMAERKAVILQAELSNTSEGYDQKFNLGFIFVGDDGMFRCQEPVGSYGGKITDLDNLDKLNPIIVGPGQTENLEIITYIPSDVKNIKLIITGDIDTVMNLD